MIRTRFATVTAEPWGCITRFVIPHTRNGNPVPAQHHPDDPHYRVISHRCGYQDDTLAYCREHEVAHLVLEEVLHDRPSTVLFALAHGRSVAPEQAAYEELAAQALQRFVRANERPIVGGVPWDRLKARMEEVLQCSAS